METYPLVDQKFGGRAYAFEIENAYISPAAVARLLTTVAGVTDLNKRPLFGSFDDEVHIKFKYLNRDFIVWEPFGDNSRYWIGPKNPEEHAAGIEELEKAFQIYRPPLPRVIIGSLLTLRLFSPHKKEEP